MLAFVKRCKVNSSMGLTETKVRLARGRLDHEISKLFNEDRGKIYCGLFGFWLDVGRKDFSECRRFFENWIVGVLERYRSANREGFSETSMYFKALRKAPFLAS